jgi:hypothetical protein
MGSGASILTGGNILAYARQMSAELAVPDELSANLELICEAIEQNNTLNNLGRKVLIRQLAHNIINNCMIRRRLEENPAIARNPLPSPVFIIGLPRTGTSLLHRLLALDTENRTLKLHEALTPAGIPEQRERYAETWSAVMNRIIPGTRHMIEIDTTSPVECCFLKRNSLLCRSLGYQAALGDLEQSLLSARKMNECYDFYKLQLQLLEQESTSGRWLLKCPSHFPAIEHIYSRFPDAAIICTSRDITETVSSFSSLISTIRSGLSRNLSREKVALELMQGIRLQMEIHRRFKNGERITRIHYPELTADPVGSVSEIYHRNRFHYSTRFEKAMIAWLRKNPHQKHGKHVHAPSMFGLNRHFINEVFASIAMHSDGGNR